MTKEMFMGHLTRCLRLMREWDWEQNTGLNPSLLTQGSNKKAWWVCSRCGEKWRTTIVSRARGQTTGCPYCCDPPLRASKNRNLKVMFPDVARQIHPTKNGEISADSILPFSNKMLWFVCDNGHEYRMAVATRTKQDQGCPKCNKSVSRIQLRVFSEVASCYLDARLEDRSLGVEVDVLVPSIKLGIEIDGWRWHRGKDVRDRKKNETVEAQGYVLFRLRELPLAKIRDFDLLHKELPNDDEKLAIVISLFQVISHHLGIENPYGNPVRFCDDEGYRHLVAIRGKIPADKTVQIKFPELVWVWSDKNDVSPSEVRYGEHRNLWWRCRAGHDFQAQLWRMIAALKRGASSLGCPYCSGRYASKDVNLAVVAPHLVGQWNGEKNGDLIPDDFRPGSNKKVWWKCEKGHEWQAVIWSRVSGCGCPACYKNPAKPLENSL